MNWFYDAGGVGRGPMSTEQMAALFQAGTLRRATLVWSEGMANWAPLGESSLLSELGPKDRLAPAGAHVESRPGPATGASSFIGSIRTCLRKYGSGRGRARRSEFWYFVLFGLLGAVAFGLVDAAAFGRGAEVGLFGGLFSLALVLPNVAVGVRRLHDTDRSGWWLLISVVPLIGPVVLLVFFIQAGTPSENRFGAASTA